MRIAPMNLGSGAAALLLGAMLTACSGDLITNESPVDKPALLARAPAPAVSPVALGKLIYFDKGMSRNSNQSCASCHSPEWGFAGPGDGSITTDGGQYAFFEGSIPTRFGSRKPPSAAYASFSPVQTFSRAEGYVGGLFWDGRAKGSRVLTPVQEQVLGPFQADKEHAFSRVCILWEINKRYANEFNALSPVKLSSVPFTKIGATTADRDRYCHTGTVDLPANPSGFTATELTNLTNAYHQVGIFVGAYEASPEVNRFSSKWDDVREGKAVFTAEELQGEQLFNDHCQTCHGSKVTGGAREIFNDHEFYNLGVPRHPLRATLRDRGLGAVVSATPNEFDGHFRNATTRNVDKRLLGGAIPGAPKTYMHNGVFTSLEQVVHFYNTRDTKACPPNVTYGAGWVRFPTVADAPSASARGICWPAPDYPDTIDQKIGNMGLTREQEAAVIAYMRTMTDR